MWFSLLVIVLYFIQIVDVVVFVFVFNSLAEQPRIVSIVVIVDESVYGVTNRTSWVEESWLNLTWTVNDEPTDRSFATRTFYTYYNSTEFFFFSNIKIQPKQQSNNVVDDEEDRKNLRSLYYIPYNTANYLSEREHLADDTHGIKVHFLNTKIRAFQ